MPFQAINGDICQLFNNHYATINMVLHLSEKKNLSHKRDFPFFINTDSPKKRLKTLHWSKAKQILLSVFENDEYVVVRKQLPLQRSQA